MGFFETLRHKAAADPRVVVLPELGIDQDGVIREAIDRARAEGTAIPIGLTPEVVERSGLRNAFVKALAERKSYGEEAGELSGLGRGIRIAERVVRRLPTELFFACMMVEQGYAHGVVAGRYLTSADVAMTAKLTIGEQEGQIVSSMFFRQPPESYGLFDLIANADMVANQNPTADELCRIVVTSAMSFEAFTGREPRIAVLSYVTGTPQPVQMAKDPELKKIEAALALYRRAGHKWMMFPSQFDAAIDPGVAAKKGAPFTDRPADILVSPNLMQANPIYKALERLIPGGESMFITQGFRHPVMDLSRGDSAANIANVIAACSLQARMVEAQRGRRAIDTLFLG